MNRRSPWRGFKWTAHWAIPVMAIVRRRSKASPWYQKSRPRFSLLLFCLVCLLVSLLVAWAGIWHQLNPTPHTWAGFQPDTPRQEGFVEPGRLTYDVIEDIHGGNGLHARLHVRIKLNHDRVFLHSIENCVTEIRHVPYSLQDSLSVGDPTFVETFVTDQLIRFNGT